jgi:hypothetical protein
MMHPTRRSLLRAGLGVIAAVTPSHFGARGDGQADDTVALQRMADWLSHNGGLCMFPAGRTFIHSTGIVFSGSDYSILGNGAVLKMADGVTADSHGFGAKFKGLRFNVRGLTIDGNRAGRAPRELPCHSFAIEGAHSGVFEACMAINATCDGWNVWETSETDITTWPRDISLIGCSARNSFRNGLSIINGYDLRVIGGDFSHSNGTAPEAGIDLEADPGCAVPSMERVLLTDVSALGNRGVGFQMSSVGRPSSITWRRLSADGVGSGHAAIGFLIDYPIQYTELHAANFSPKHCFTGRGLSH